MNGKKRTRVVASNEDTKNDIQVEVYTNFEQLQAIQQEWDSFVESVDAEIFLTYDWCRIWWKYYGKNRDLNVFLFRSNDKLVSIIPLFFERIWLGPISVRVVKFVGSDFTISQFSIPIDGSYMRAMVEKLCERLCELNWDIIHIGPIAGLYEQSTVLKDTLAEIFGSSSIVSVEEGSVQTYVQLADGWEKQLDRLSKNQRRTIKRSYKDLSKAASEKGLTLASNIASNENFEEMFNGFVQMHQSHWKNAGEQGHFGDWPCALEFHSEVAAAQLKKNRLRLLEVKLGEHWLGYEYDYRFANRYHAILNARAEVDELPGVSPTVSIGSILYAEQVKNAIKENVRCIDMMRGSDNYKLRLGGKLYPVRNIFIYRRKPLVLVRIGLFRLLAWLLNVCYYKIWFRRIAPRLPLKRGPLWKIWIRSRMFA